MIDDAEVCEVPGTGVSLVPNGEGYRAREWVGGVDGL